MATIANIAAMFAALGFERFLLPDYVWLILVLLGVTWIVITVKATAQNIAFAPALLWGLTGILARQLPQFTFGWASGSMWIVMAIILCILAVAIRWVFPARQQIAITEIKQTTPTPDGRVGLLLYHARGYMLHNLRPGPSAPRAAPHPQYR